MAKGLTFGIPWSDYNAGLRYNDNIAARDDSKTLLEFYCLRHKYSASEEGWLQRIGNGQISVDGQVVTSPNFILRTGTRLEYYRFPWKEPDAPYLLQVLHEDDDVVALNKPSGLQVLPGGLFQQRTVLTQLQWRDGDGAKLLITKSSPLPHGSWATSPVHRLGRGTSGILLCAKTPQAKSRLAADLAEGTESMTGRTRKQELYADDKRVLKTYRALACGLIKLDEMIVDQPIERLPYPGVAGGLYMASSSGKSSLSKVVVLWRDKVANCTLVQVEIFTGRPHQIRIHLASIGHPLVDDPLYVAGGRPSQLLQGNCVGSSCHVGSPAEDGGYLKSSNALPGDIGYQLHAWRLEFYHPVSEKKMMLIAPPPLSLQIPGEECQDYVKEL